MGNGIKPLNWGSSNYCGLYYFSSLDKKAQQQIDAVYNLLDVFMAAQAPTMIEAKQKYEHQLSELSTLIEERKEDIETIRNPFLGQGPLIDMVEDSYRKEEQYEHLTALEDKRKEIQDQLSLIQSYFNRAKYNSPQLKMEINKCTNL